MIGKVRSYSQKEIKNIFNDETLNDFIEEYVVSKEDLLDFIKVVQLSSDKENKIAYRNYLNLLFLIYRDIINLDKIGESLDGLSGETGFSTLLEDLTFIEQSVIPANTNGIDSDLLNLFTEARDRSTSRFVMRRYLPHAEIGKGVVSHSSIKNYESLLTLAVKEHLGDEFTPDTLLANVIEGPGYEASKIAEYLGSMKIKDLVRMNGYMSKELKKNLPALSNIINYNSENIYIIERVLVFNYNEGLEPLRSPNFDDLVSSYKASLDKDLYAPINGGESYIERSRRIIIELLNAIEKRIIVKEG